MLFNKLAMNVTARPLSAGGGVSGSMSVWFCWALISCVTVAAYSNSLYGEFLFDDANAIVDNGTIRDLSNLPLVLAAPPRGGSTTDARPLLNLSLAMNYAIHGLQPFGYHLFNLLVHLLNAGMVLLLLRRLFGSPAAPNYLSGNSEFWALACTLMWSLHPVQTSAVSYISQRAESMGCFFYLAVLYLDLTVKQLSRWRILVCIPLLLGGFCKEIIVTAPIVSWVLQRWHFGRSWLESWSVGKRELGFRFLALAPVVVLAFVHGGRSGTAASSSGEAVTAVEYLIAQGYVVPRYLLSIMNPFWVCTDYGLYPPSSIVISFAGLAILASLLVWSVTNVVSCKSLGLPVLCAAIFLAPSSSIIPIVTQIGGEHRVYLSSLAVFVLLSAFLAKILSHAGKHSPRRLSKAALWSVTSLSLGLAMCTFITNRSFASLEAFWERSVAQMPENLRARQNLAAIDLSRGELDQGFRRLESLVSDKRQGVAARLEAAELAEQAKQIARVREYLRPIFHERRQHAKASVIEARLLVLENEPVKAIHLCEQILEDSPNESSAWNALALALRSLSRISLEGDATADLAAIEQRTEEALQRALELLPWSANDRFMLAGLYLDQTRDQEAERELRQCLLYDPMRAEAWYWLAVLHAQQGDKELARSEIATSLALQHTPDAEQLAQMLGR
jgi:protein O-mannosyl-transferase